MLRYGEGGEPGEINKKRAFVRNILDLRTRNNFRDQKVTKLTRSIVVNLYNNPTFFPPRAFHLHAKHSGSVCRCTLCKSLRIRASAKWLKCKCKMTGPGDLPALDVCVRVCVLSTEFRFALDKRGARGENIFVPKRRKMNRGICRHKSVSDRLKGWNRERSDTLVGFLKWQLLSVCEGGNV